MIGVVAAATVAAVEFADINETKFDVQDSLDAAVLAGTLRPDLDEPGINDRLQADVEAFFRAELAKADLRVSEVIANFSFDAARDRVVGNVTFTYDTIFIGSVLGVRTVNLRAEAAPERPVKIEMALALDVSGSMKWPVDEDDVEAPLGSRRLDALSSGVEALLASLAEEDRVEPVYAVIPFSSSVDLTDLYDAGQASWFTGINGQPVPNVCAGGRSADPADCDPIDNPNASQLSDPVQSPVGAWAAERYTSKTATDFTLSLNAPGTGNAVPVVTQGPRSVNCHPGNVETFGHECIEVTTDPLRAEQDFYAPRVGILPLTDDIQAVSDFVGALEPQGATAAHLGAMWGLYALTAEWNDVFQHPYGEPTAFESRTRKVLVIMTDGANTVVHDNSLAETDHDIYFQSVCAKARDLGVTIYAVGMRLSEVTDALLTQCAGTASQYFPADSQEDLVAAFDEIAKDAARVRLSH